MDALKEATKDIKNPEVAAALIDFMVARSIQRLAFKEYHEAVQDLLPSEEAKKAVWEAAKTSTYKLRHRVQFLAEKAVQDSLYDPAINYADAVMDEVAVWKVTYP